MPAAFHIYILRRGDRGILQVRQTVACIRMTTNMPCGCRPTNPARSFFSSVKYNKRRQLEDIWMEEAYGNPKTFYCEQNRNQAQDEAWRKWHVDIVECVGNADIRCEENVKHIRRMIIRTSVCAEDAVVHGCRLPAYNHLRHIASESIMKVAKTLVVSTTQRCWSPVRMRC